MHIYATYGIKFIFELKKDLTLSTAIKPFLSQEQFFNMRKRNRGVSASHRINALSGTAKDNIDIDFLDYLLNLESMEEMMEFLKKQDMKTYLQIPLDKVR